MPPRVIELPHDPRLGRHVVHDPLSRNFDLADEVREVRFHPVEWRRIGPIFDQGRIAPEILTAVGADPAEDSVGCCTMCAAYGLLLTEPFHRPGTDFTMRDVLTGYHLETTLDERAIPGVWPPEDTGSAGLYAMKVLRRQGRIRSYRHAFNMPTARRALNRGPIAVGTAWYDSMFSTVERDGRQVLEIARSASVVGGHEWIAHADDPDASMIGMTNSWGDWGDDGTAWMAYDTFERLLAEQGDVHQPVL